ncbi:hypothetical protein DY000_02021989 [Brassica cretica]|uniref:Uncharacterized protein n=1 Tax=Brassica cretica TaxID=69181 RepID=A0ABQ7E240_BRACR|nr:hypothetical protein DY000_02021989 [Brassica cretica]
MENMDFGRTSIDKVRALSIDMSTEISIGDAHRTSIDNTPSEAGKYSLTDDANVRVVLGEPKVEEAGENRSRPIILDDPNTESEIPRERERPNTEKEAIDLEEEEGELEEDVEID